MKAKKRHCRPASIAKTRWAAYAAASAATALAGSQTADAAIHYSGFLNVPFPPHQNSIALFSLDQTADYLFISHFEFFSTFDGFSVTAVNGGAFRGYQASGLYASRLDLGENVSSGAFVSGFGGNLEVFRSGRAYGQFGDHGRGFVGFRFDGGAGTQYGWARVKMMGIPETGFRVLDYAYADPGEPIFAGQISSDEQAPEPDQGSLGGLAVGAVGLFAWRKSRSLAAR